MRNSPVWVLLFASLAWGCGAARHLPSTLGERSSGYGYVPLDGLGIIQGYDLFTCYQDQDPKKPRVGDWRSLLDALPDVSARFAVASINGETGALTFGPAKVTVEGSAYRAVLDYVNVDAVPVPFYVRKSVHATNAVPSARGLLAVVEPGEDVTGYEARVYYGNPSEATPMSWVKDGFDPITVPVYVGIGLRLTADIRALKGGVVLSSLGALGAQAQASTLAGTFTVQTLGVTGQAVSTALPLPSTLDQTTVENGILALGTSRALIYNDEAGKVGKTARIVGLYSPVEPDPRLINVLYSQLASNRPTWFRPCGPPVR